MFEKVRILLSYLDKKKQRHAKIYLILSLISPVIDLFSISMVIPIVTQVINNNEYSIELLFITLGMIGIIILRGIVELYRTKLSNNLVYSAMHDISSKIFEVCLKEDLLEHNKKSAMQTLTIIRNDTTASMNLIVLTITLISNTMTFIGYSLALIYVSSFIGAMTVIIMIMLILMMYYFNNRQVMTLGKEKRLSGIKVNAKVTLAYGAFKELKIGTQSERILQEYNESSKEYAGLESVFEYRRSIISALMQNVSQAIIFVLLAFIIYFRLDVLSFFASVLVYLAILIRMIALPYVIVNSLVNIQVADESYKSVLEKLNDYQVLKNKEKELKKVRHKEITFHDGLSIDNISFEYIGNHPVLENISLFIPKGSCIAITGLSGCGKTTFCDIILGLLKPQSGSVKYDDYDIVSHRDNEGICEGNIGSIISYIPQTVYLNGETIEENVTYLSDTKDKNKIIDALKQAQIWEDVKNMPDGLHTLIGENGTAISGGQRQRIALARAFYKEFEILVMDEATAALDMETEKTIIESIKAMKNSKTIIIVTHHSSLADVCDHVYHIENHQMTQIR
ncbi:MAG: ABC transporter ATP-binding protein/permease [Erysipelotrichaceae bacterium]|nr:ABC transporter ATP-binding protein/permease [Erysipelotrichaceae bacterium]